MNNLTHRLGLLEIDESGPPPLTGTQDDRKYSTTSSQSEIELPGAFPDFKDSKPGMRINRQLEDLSPLAAWNNAALRPVPSPIKRELKRQSTAETNSKNDQSEHARPEIVHPNPLFRFQSSLMSTSSTGDEQEPQGTFAEDALKYIPHWQQRPGTPPIVRSDYGSADSASPPTGLAGTTTEQDPEETSDATSSTVGDELGISSAHTEPCFRFEWKPDMESRTFPQPDSREECTAAPTWEDFPLPESTHVNLPPTNPYVRHIKEKKEHHSDDEASTPPPDPSTTRSSKPSVKGKERAVDTESNSSQCLDCLDEDEVPRDSGIWTPCTEIATCAGPCQHVLREHNASIYCYLTIPQKAIAEAKIHEDYVAQLKNIHGPNSYRQPANPMVVRFLAKVEIHRDHIARLADIEHSGRYGAWDEAYNDYVARLVDFQNSTEDFVSDGEIYNAHEARIAGTQDINTPGQSASWYEKCQAEIRVHEDYIARLANLQYSNGNGQAEYLKEEAKAQAGFYYDYTIGWDTVQSQSECRQYANREQKYEELAKANRKYSARLQSFRDLNPYRQPVSDIAQTSESMVRVAESIALAAESIAKITHLIGQPSERVADTDTAGSTTTASDSTATESQLGEAQYDQDLNSSGPAYEHIEYYDDGVDPPVSLLEDRDMFNILASQLEQDGAVEATPDPNLKGELRFEVISIPKFIQSVKSIMQSWPNAIALDSPKLPESITEDLYEPGVSISIEGRKLSIHGERVGPQDDEGEECPDLVDASNSSEPLGSTNTFTNVATGRPWGTTPPGSPQIPKQEIDDDASSLNATGIEASSESVHEPGYGPVPMALRAYRSMQDLTSLMMKGTISTAKRAFSTEKPDGEASGKTEATDQGSPGPGQTPTAVEKVLYDVDLGNSRPDQSSEDEDWISVCNRHELDDARSSENYFAPTIPSHMVKGQLQQWPSVPDIGESARSMDTAVVDVEEAKKREHRNPKSEETQYKEPVEPLDSWVGI